jgi:hypothetical protein
MKKLVKVENGRYIVTDETGTTIALVYRWGNGYRRDVRNAQTGEFFRPEYFNYFKTLADVKRRYDIK